MFYPLNYLIMAKVIKVSNRVKQCLHLLDSRLFSGLCQSFSVSFRYSRNFSCEVWLYPAQDWTCFADSEIAALVDCCQSFQLSFVISSEIGLPVVRITDFNLSDNE